MREKLSERQAEQVISADRMVRDNGLVQGKKSLEIRTKCSVRARKKTERRKRQQKKVGPSPRLYFGKPRLFVFESVDGKRNRGP